MRPATGRSDLGRLLYGAAAIGFGAIALIWHDYRHWDQFRAILNPSSGPLVLALTALAQLAGGAALLDRRTAKLGALLAGAAYLVFALLCVPRIAATPRVYDAWGNLFEQLALASGALLVAARTSSRWPQRRVEDAGRVLIAVCTASFAIEQAVYLNATAGLVPAWIPPGPRFWADVTTALFALAAIALLVDRGALLASRLLALMLLGFGVIVWLPLLAAGPHRYGNWSETIETFAIAGSVWILAELLAGRASPDRATRRRR